jgi:hypothetical protein
MGAWLSPARPSPAMVLDSMLVLHGHILQLGPATLAGIQQQLLADVVVSEEAEMDRGLMRG